MTFASIAVSAFRRVNRAQGFTLVESMVVIVLISVVAGWVTPQMRELFIETRLSLNVNDLLAATKYARAEAIRRGRLVTICRSVNADLGVDACDTAASGDRTADDWGVGWLVFVENNSSTSGLGVVSPGDEILLRQGALPLKTFGPSTAKRLSYNGIGEPTGSFAGMHFKFNFNGKFERIICVNRVGRVRVIRDKPNC
jgi:type IV fimbrial biogenesis protein FimT